MKLRHISKKSRSGNCLAGASTRTWAARSCARDPTKFREQALHSLPERVGSKSKLFAEEFAGFSVELDLNEQLHIRSVDESSSAGAIEQMTKQDLAFQRILIEDLGKNP